jgi:hypothetical protein
MFTLAAEVLSRSIKLTSPTFARQLIASIEQILVLLKPPIQILMQDLR